MYLLLIYVFIGIINGLLAIFANAFSKGSEQAFDQADRISDIAAMRAYTRTNPLNIFGGMNNVNLSNVTIDNNVNSIHVDTNVGKTTEMIDMNSNDKSNNSTNNIPSNVIDVDENKTSNSETIGKSFSMFTSASSSNRQVLALLRKLSDDMQLLKADNVALRQEISALNSASRHTHAHTI